MIYRKIHICDLCGLHELCKYVSSNPLLQKMISHMCHICNPCGLHEFTTIFTFVTFVAFMAFMNCMDVFL